MGRVSRGLFYTPDRPSRLFRPKNRLNRLRVPLASPRLSVILYLASVPFA